MKISVLSCKGGTGKTFITVNLATIEENSMYIDCDVEEPNGHLFLKPLILERKNVSVLNPRIDDEKCNGCRKCVDFCKFNALAYIKSKVKVFNEICHSCGGCFLICPQKAITENIREIGIVEIGTSKKIRTKSGYLNIGEASGVPIIEELIKNMPNNGHVFIDSPPGSSCLVTESIKDSDYCIIVIEPTIYGVSNAKLVYELVKLINKPVGVILNKITDDALIARKFCKENNINILSEFIYDDEIAKTLSDGKILALENEKYFGKFEDIMKNIEEAIKNERVSDNKW